MCKVSFDSSLSPRVPAPSSSVGSVLKRGWQECPVEWCAPAAAEAFAAVRQMRDVAMRALDEARGSKAIRSFLEATACVTFEDQALEDVLHVSVHCCLRCRLVCVCVCACVRACVRACVCVCVCNTHCGMCLPVWMPPLCTVLLLQEPHRHSNQVAV